MKIVVSCFCHASPNFTCQKNFENLNDFEQFFAKSSSMKICLPLMQLGPFGEVGPKFPPTTLSETHFALELLNFVLILYVPSTIFQLNRDGSSWVEPVLS